MLSSASASRDVWAGVDDGGRAFCCDFDILDFPNRTDMKILALLIAIYAPLMLLIHVSTGRILEAWNEQPDSRISRWFPPRCALRTEALFWVLALVSWFLWQSLVWRVLVVVFAAIHLGIWAADEFRVNSKNGSAFTASPTMKRAIIGFDLAEAVVLAGIGTVAILYLTHAV